MKKTQQLNCYTAEAILAHGERFTSVEAAQRWVDDLRDKPWWHLQGFSIHVLRIEVGWTRKKMSVGWYDASKNAGRIELCAGGRDTVTALHEVAHVLASAVGGSRSHDPAWARTYLTLVSCVMGAGEYLRLQHAFDAHGVDYDAPAPRASGIAL